MWFIVQTKHFYKLCIHMAHNGLAQSILATNRKDNKEPCCSKSFNLTQATKQRRKNKVLFMLCQFDTPTVHATQLRKDEACREKHEQCSTCPFILFEK